MNGLGHHPKKWYEFYIHYKFMYIFIVLKTPHFDFIEFQKIHINNSYIFDFKHFFSNS